MPTRLSSKRRAGHTLWVELNNVSLESVCMKANRAKEENGNEKMGFEIHGRKLR